MKNIKENCLIKINLSQKIPFEKDCLETVSLQTNGNFFKMKGAKHITYKDYEEYTGRERICTIKINGNMVTFSKSGEIKSCMVFENKKRHQFKHPAPNGYFMLGVFTEKIEDNLEKYGWMRIHYSLDANIELISENKVEIVLKLL